MAEGQFQPLCGQRLLCNDAARGAVRPPLTSTGFAKPASTRGRPPIYKPEYAGQAKQLCMLGSTDSRLAEGFGVSVKPFRTDNRSTRNSVMHRGRPPCTGRAGRSPAFKRRNWMDAGDAASTAAHHRGLDALMTSAGHPW